jgi:polyisoprenoid-binding protein YceI
MMTMPRRSLGARPLLALVLAALALCGAAARADADGRVGRLDLDPHHTVVAFHLGGNLHEVHGTFALSHGTLTVDPATGTASGTIVVDATSGESGNASRDSRMASSVLETNRFPEIVFRAERADGHREADGTFHASLYGTLTLHGADHDAVVTVDGHLDGDVLSARGRFTVPYVAWGLPDPSILLLTVAKTVDVDVTTEGRVTWNQP